jgi:hypothetical protein
MDVEVSDHPPPGFITGVANMQAIGTIRRVVEVPPIPGRVFVVGHG